MRNMPEESLENRRIILGSCLGLQNFNGKDYTIEIL